MSETKIVRLKLARKHPKGAFRVGATVVTGYVFAEYELTTEQCEELNSVGCKHWVAVDKGPSKAEIKKRAQEKLEAERLEAERLEAERLEAERLEAERLANENKK